MPDRLDAKVGETLPLLRFWRRLPIGQTWPSVTGASATLLARNRGTVAPVFSYSGTVSITVDGRMLSGTFAPDEPYSVVPRELDAELNVEFAGGDVVRFPGAEDGIGRVYRISVVDTIGESASEQGESNEIVGYVGPWIGQWAS